MKTLIKSLKISLLIKVILLPSFIQAYEMLTCNAESLSECVLNISNSLDIEGYELCELESLNSVKNYATQEKFYYLTCPYNSFFLKKDHSDSYQRNKKIQDYLSRNCLSEFCSRLLKSVGEVSLISQSDTVNYSIFPYIEGKTLATIKQDMYSDGLNREKLNILYRSLGLTLGSLHSSGMINNGVTNDFYSLKSNLVHGDLYSGNIIIKPDNTVFLVDIDLLYKSVTSAVSIFTDINTVILLVIPTTMLLSDDQTKSDWISAIPEFYTSFLGGYCSELTTIAHSECDSLIREHVVMVLRIGYLLLSTSADDSAPYYETEPAIFTNRYVLEYRLRKLL